LSFDFTIPSELFNVVVRSNRWVSRFDERNIRLFDTIERQIKEGGHFIAPLWPLSDGQSELYYWPLLSTVAGYELENSIIYIRRFNW